MFGKKDPNKSPKDTGGPVVKTGPTRGNNRSRNDDGQWRKKRSDTGTKKKGCYITTAVCEFRGLPDNCHELISLRAFRDDVLLPTVEGRNLVEHYYEIAPSIAASLRDPVEIEAVWKSIQECLASITAGKNDEAIAKYKSMTYGLLSKVGKSVA